MTDSHYRTVLCSPTEFDAIRNKEKTIFSTGSVLLLPRAIIEFRRKPDWGLAMSDITFMPALPDRVFAVVVDTWWDDIICGHVVSVQLEEPQEQPNPYKMLRQIADKCDEILARPWGATPADKVRRKTRKPKTGPIICDDVYPAEPEETK